MQPRCAGCRHAVSGVSRERDLGRAGRGRTAIACGVSGGCALCARVLRGVSLLSGRSRRCAFSARVLRGVSLFSGSSRGCTLSAGVTFAGVSAAGIAGARLATGVAATRFTTGVAGARLAAGVSALVVATLVIPAILVIPAFVIPAALVVSAFVVAAAGIAATVVSAETPAMDGSRRKQGHRNANCQTDYRSFHCTRLSGNGRACPLEVRGKSVTWRAAL